MAAATPSSPPPIASTSASAKGHHRRTSSLWVPPSRPAFSNPAPRIRHKAESSSRALKGIFNCRCLACCPFGQRNSPNSPENRTVIPNHRFDSSTPRYEHPNRTKYADNRVRTTKYSLLTFLPKNLFEQFHRFANLYFIFIVMLNWVPAIEAFGRYLSMIPITFVLMVTAVKDAFEDYRRYKCDQKINHATCRVWDSDQGRYRKMEWQHVLVGDVVHLSCNEIIPADILLLRSSDPLGTCYVETSNLDGESNLKQRRIINSMVRYSGSICDFKPTDFTSTIECESPNNQIYRFNGFLLHEDGTREAISKSNLLLRGCEMRNTDFVEGIVVYAGRDTKAMLNNSGPRYKRSDLERRANWDILACVIILFVMCMAGAVASAFWLNSYADPNSILYLTFMQDPNGLQPAFEGFINFFSYIIVLQVMIPISLYVSIEIIKLGQIYLMSQDMHLYYAPADKRIQCRALNIPEELGQIQFVMSDKTGTLTENQMIFRRCSVAGHDFGPDMTSSAMPVGRLTRESVTQVVTDPELVRRVAALNETLFSVQSSNDAVDCASYDDNCDIYDFFCNMAICNTVVVNAQPHQDHLDESGFFVGDTFVTGNSAFHLNDNKVYTLNSDALRAPRPPHRLPPMAHPSTTSLTPIDRPCSSSSTRQFATAAYHNTATSASMPPLELHDVRRNSIDSTRSIDEQQLQRTTGNQQETSLSIVPEESMVTGDDIDQKPNRLNNPRPSMLSLNLSKLHIRSLKGLSPLLRFRKGSTTSDRSESPCNAVPNPIYEAESPDELSLVYAACAYGVRLLKRHANQLVLELPGGRRQRFRVLATLPFDSERKRMSVIVQTPFDDAPLLYCKGADMAIFEVLSDQFVASAHGQSVIFKAQQHLSAYGGYGLRTLCLAKRSLTEAEYREWKQLHDAAEMDIENRERLLFESAMRIEVDMQLIGVTGIEDRLQDGVPECIDALRQAGIKVWVLTGDKIETAVNIAYASKLFAPGMELIQLGAKNEQDTAEMLDHLIEQLETKFADAQRGGCGRRSRLRVTADERGALLDMMPAASSLRPNIGLVVNGQTLAFCLLPSIESKFVDIVSRCSSVLCCRATPLQKASVVKVVKERLKCKVLAIGDGANDVSMIQCADVGVGISGQEGMQAVMASDFALARFRFLQRLLLVHGHWCYYRLAQTILYFFYKNAMFVFAIFWYQLFNGFSAQVPIDPIYLMIYNLVFTSVPSLLYGIIEQDASDTLLMQVPALYTTGRLGLLYRRHSFWLHIIDALWQSMVVYFVAHMTYMDSTCDMWSFGLLLCTSLLLSNSLQLAMQVQLWTLPFFLSLVGSLFAFLVFALIYNLIVTPAFLVKDIPVNVAERLLSDGRYWPALFLSSVLALLPRFTLTVLINTHQPSDVLQERIKKRMKTAAANNNNAGGGGNSLVNSVRARWSKKEKTVRIQVMVEQSTSPSSQDSTTAVLHL